VKTALYILLCLILLSGGVFACSSGGGGDPSTHSTSSGEPSSGQADDDDDDDDTDDDSADDDFEWTGPGTWVSRAPLAMPRSSLSAVAVNGLVYAIGGFNFLLVPDRPLSSVEVYDPATDSWSEGVPLPDPRGAATAVSLGGKIYVAGGFAYEGSSNWFLDRTDVFDPQTGQWTQLPSLSTGRSLAAGSVFEEEFLVLGGRNDEAKAFQTLNAVEAYNPTIAVWSALAPLPGPREAPAAVSASGFVWLAGGWDGTPSGYLHDLLRYDPAMGTWDDVDDLSMPRCSLASALLGNRYAVFVGGYLDAWPPFPDAVDVYDTQAGAWVEATPLPAGRGGSGAAVVDGRLFVIGGADYDEPTHTAWYPRPDVWEFILD